MNSTLILYIVFGLLLSFSIAFFQYYYKNNQRIKATPILFLLKASSLFLLILLFLNPKIEKLKITNEKPVLSILVDNSKSISFFNEENTVNQIVKSLEENNKLKEKFELQKFTFGNTLDVFDSVSFSDTHTNISDALQATNELQKDKISPIVILTDGNQTKGLAYEFFKSKQPVYPIVIGDTTKYEDLSIAQVNVNKYSYINNQFPIEVILNYEGNNDTDSQFSISKNGKVVFRKNISFSSQKKSITLTTNLTSTQEGLQYYTASLNRLENEKNTKNNSKSFSIEVINEQTQILFLTSILHPDLGAFKKTIESNKQRSVTIENIENKNIQLNDFQLVILYQPNEKFNTIFNEIKAQNSNYFIVTGANTSWNLINQKELGFRKNAINQTEKYGGFYNDTFLTFFQEDIGFSNFPPLEDKFGEISLTQENQTLLFQSINGIQTNQPLLSTFEINAQKSAVLFGEGIWKWRAASFLNSNSFEEFDKFMGNLIQYLASNKKRNRLEVNAENSYPANSTINISAFFTDKNYKFDDRANLEITVTNIATNQKITVPFSLINNSFQAEIENLNSGEYRYQVAVMNQNITKSGRFKITEYQIEEQFTNANSNNLKLLASNSNGKLFYKNQTSTLVKELLENKSFYTVQKSTTIKEHFINFKALLFLIITLLTIEWIIRKYYGKI